MVEKFDPLKEAPVAEIVDSLRGDDDRVWFESELIKLRTQLKDMPSSAGNLERAEVELGIAEALIGLNRLEEAWESTRPLLDIFIQENQFELAVRSCRVMYQSDQEDSIAALGQGCWLAVTYPINPVLSVEMLHNIVDETPDQSDGGAVAAMAAHYVAELRGEKERENLIFLTTQILAKVAKRHRNIDDEESIKIWIEILELNDTDKLFERLSKIIDTISGDEWWFDREQLRTQLPVN